jgi:hypothetical protein
MLLDLLDIACRAGAEPRALASLYVTRYGIDALVLARMAHADVVERSRDDRAALYTAVIAILMLRRDHAALTASPARYMQMIINDWFTIVEHRIAVHRCQDLEVAVRSGRK